MVPRHPQTVSSCERDALEGVPSSLWPLLLGRGLGEFFLPWEGASSASALPEGVDPPPGAPGGSAWPGRVQLPRGSLWTPGPSLCREGSHHPGPALCPHPSGRHPPGGQNGRWRLLEPALSGCSWHIRLHESQHRRLLLNSFPRIPVANSSTSWLVGACEKQLSCGPVSTIFKT